MTKQTEILLPKLSKREWGNLFSHPFHDTLPSERCRHKAMQIAPQGAAIEASRTPKLLGNGCWMHSQNKNTVHALPL
jgi:hypothetical protein